MQGTKGQIKQIVEVLHECARLQKIRRGIAIDGAMASNPDWALALVRRFRAALVSAIYWREEFHVAKAARNTERMVRCASEVDLAELTAFLLQGWFIPENPKASSGESHASLSGARRAPCTRVRKAEHGTGRVRDFRPPRKRGVAS